jgi:hypothetical protein
MSSARNGLVVAVMMLGSWTKAADRPVIVPITLQGQFPVVTVKINGIDVPLIFDLGNASALALTQDAIDRTHATQTGKSSRSMDLKGNIVQVPKFNIGRLQIGDAVFTDFVADLDVHDPTYQASQVGQQGFLGTGLLKKYNLVIDYGQRTLTFVPPVSVSGQADICRGTPVPFSPAWHGEPAVEAETDFGRATVFLDTGSPTSAISKRLAMKRNPPAPGDTSTSARLVIAGTDFGPLQFAVEDMDPRIGFDGIIGYNFLIRHVVCVNFRDERLLIQK